jgi:hypothetical protein
MFFLFQDFFFKPKKFNLLLMPLVNKSKNYKNDNVCKAKALAWLCLIENINDRISQYVTSVVIPFLNYCFGSGDASHVENGLSSEESASLSQQSSTKNFLQTRRSCSTLWSTNKTTTHANKLLANKHCEFLMQIGFEFYTAFVCNGSKENVPDEYLSLFKTGI